jgi:2-C-methyl-D-erythritol 4-phosphate cytidylyltransferase
MISAIIVAAGKGLRMGTSRPKQFLRLGSLPILARTLRVFDGCSSIDEIVVVLPEPDIEYFRNEILPRAALKKDPCVAAGGRYRQDSVMNGLTAVKDKAGLVLIHDGVRPLVTTDLIEAVAQGAKKWGACIPVVPATDTVKRVDKSGVILETPSRHTFRLAQTPQGFRYSIIQQAHENAAANGVEATDDASLVEALGVDVRTIEGSRRNIKITTSEDLALAEIYLKNL